MIQLYFYLSDLEQAHRLPEIVWKISGQYYPSIVSILLAQINWISLIGLFVFIRTCVVNLSYLFMDYYKKLYEISIFILSTQDYFHNWAGLYFSFFFLLHLGTLLLIKMGNFHKVFRCCPNGRQFVYESENCSLLEANLFV